MKKIRHTFFLSCLKTSELVEKKLYLKLSIKEKMQLKIHKMICNACNMYEKQSNLLKKGIESIPTPTPPEIDFEQLKKELLTKIS